MDKQNKHTLIGSIIAGFLGSLSYICAQEIKRAEEEKRKYMEDCRIRYQHEQEQQARDAGHGNEG